MFLCGVWGHSCLTWAQMRLFNVTYNLSLPTQWQHHSTVSLWISLCIVPCFFCVLSLFTVQGFEKWN